MPRIGSATLGARVLYQSLVGSLRLSPQWPDALVSSSPACRRAGLGHAEMVGTMVGVELLGIIGAATVDVDVGIQSRHGEEEKHSLRW